MLIEGLSLMAAGMGMVFSFLILLVLIMMASARIFKHFSGPLEAPSSDKLSNEKEPCQSKKDLAEIAIAIAVAGTRHDKQE